MHIEDAEQSVGPEAIELFERFLDRKFPKDYREFLMEYNGGRPIPNCFRSVDGEECSLVHFFQKINSKHTYDDLLSNIRIHEDRMPSDFISIASDPFGNEICIVISGQDFGKIYFWDHEDEVGDGEPPTMDNMTLIAQNFKSFIESLYEGAEDA